MSKDIAATKAMAQAQFDSLVPMAEDLLTVATIAAKEGFEHPVLGGLFIQIGLVLTDKERYHDA